MPSHLSDDQGKHSLTYYLSQAEKRFEGNHVGEKANEYGKTERP